MVVTGGENVYSAQVENVIAQVPEVSIGRCDRRARRPEGWRVQPTVVVRMGQTLDAEQLVRHCRSQVAGYRCPRSEGLRTEMPLSATGSLLKLIARQDCAYSRRGWRTGLVGQPPPYICLGSQVMREGTMKHSATISICSSTNGMTPM